MRKLRTIAGLWIAVFLMLATVAVPAQAVPKPRAIQWAAPPAAFVTSLYVGVLGRKPESAAVVSKWASQVNSKPESRLNVFWRFVGLPEYQRSKWARQKKEWNLYRKRQKSGRYVYYGAFFSSGQQIGGPYILGVVKALMNFYETFYSK